MITINGVNLEYLYMGLFNSEKPWIHPTVTIDSYEIILVLCGTVKLREDKTEYSLKRGDMLLLDRNVEHGGTEVSVGNTDFYWLHFYCNDIKKLNLPKLISSDLIIAERVMKEIMHLQNVSKPLCELTLAKFLLETTEKREYKNKYAFEIAEYIRINRHLPLTVNDVSSHFGYNPDHLSRLLKKQFGTDAKTMIINRRLEYLESLLINTDYTVREIAETAGFETENSFIKFFKYHTNTTPTLFRHRFFNVNMNNS